MARPLRLQFAAAVYHLTSLGNARQKIFFNDADRELFFKPWRMSCLATDGSVMPICLMANHYPLLVETPKANLSIGMRQLNGIFTQSFNRRHKRVGHLFQARFKAILVDKEAYLLELCRYIVLNTVRVTRGTTRPLGNGALTRHQNGIRPVLPRRLFRRPEKFRQMMFPPLGSAVGLATICRKLNIPRPGLGYCAKKAVGG